MVKRGASGRFAIRKGVWVFIDSPTADDSREPGLFPEERGDRSHSFPGELYNFAADPSERTNLYPAQPARASTLKELLERYRNWLRWCHARHIKKIIVKPCAGKPHARFERGSMETGWQS